MSSATTTTTPRKYAIALFPGFQALDAFGPLDTLNLLSRQIPNLSLYILSTTLAPVTTLTSASALSVTSPSDPTYAPAASVPFPMQQSVQPTHTYTDCPDDVEVLIVPGGRGCHDPERVKDVARFIGERFGKLKFLLTVCTGSALAAQSAVLEGRRATSNKMSLGWIMERYPSVQWVKKARWVVDEADNRKVWTSSGVSAGMDMMYAFVAEVYGQEAADSACTIQEYRRIADPENDPFAKE